jgi:hypothetical protein
MLDVQAIRLGDQLPLLDISCYSHGNMNSRLSLFLVAAFLCRPVQPLQADTISAPSSSTIYTNFEYGFSIQIPSDRPVQTAGYNSLHPFISPPVAYLFADRPSTQTEGYVTINVSRDESDLARCVPAHGKINEPYGGIRRENASRVLINSIEFFRSDSLDVTGVDGIRRSYRTVHNGMCYDIEVVSIASACLAACDDRRWSMKTESELLHQLDNIARSFRFVDRHKDPPKGS